MWNRLSGKSDQANDPPSKNPSSRSNDGEKHSIRSRADSLISRASEQKADDQSGDKRDRKSYSSTDRALDNNAKFSPVASSYAKGANDYDAGIRSPASVLSSEKRRMSNSRSSRDPTTEVREGTEGREYPRSERQSRRSSRKNGESVLDDRQAVQSTAQGYDFKDGRDKRERRRKSSGSSKHSIGRRDTGGSKRDPADSDDQSDGATHAQHHLVQNGVPPQFSGPQLSQEPNGSTNDSRPTFTAAAGAPGLAAEYYGDAGQSVSAQPGVRTHSPSFVVAAEPHLQAASSVAAPPPEPSQLGGLGAAASFYSGEFDDAASTVTQQTPSIYTSAPSRPPNAHHSYSAPSTATLGSAALGGALGYTMSGGLSSNHQDADHDSATAGAQSHTSTSRPPRPSKISPHSSNTPLYAAGAAGLAAATHSHHSHSPSHVPTGYQSYGTTSKQRHRPSGPFGAVVNFVKDPDAVAQYEEYSEIIGVCRRCFEPGSTPRDAPRKHRPGKRRSKEQLGSRTRVDKQHRYAPSSSSSSDDEAQKKKGASWLGAGLAGYGLSKVGMTLFNQRNDFDDTHEVKSGRYSPSSTGKVRRRSSYEERFEVGITNDGKIGGRKRQDVSYAEPASSDHHTRQKPFSKQKMEDVQLVGGMSTDAAVTSRRRPRSRSPKQLIVEQRRHSSDESPSQRRKQQKSKKKKDKGFFSFLSPSTSSSSLDTPAASKHNRHRKRAGSSDKIKNNHEAEAALLGLGAATAALAFKDSRSGSKSTKDLVAVKERKAKSARHSIDRKASRSSSSPDDGWESASEGEISLVDSDLAFGSPSRRASFESLSSQGSGTDKSDWRWGSKHKRRSSQDRKQADNNLPGDAAFVGMPSPYVMSANQEIPSTTQSMSNAPLQHVYPVPTSDPGRFDVQTAGSYTSQARPVAASQATPMPIQQPQPITPVSANLYNSHAADSQQHSASTSSPLFSQPSYSVPPAEVRNASVISGATTFPRHVNDMDGRYKSLERSDTSPARFSEDVVSSSMAPKRRVSTKDDSSTVKFAMTEAEEQQERRERRRKRREERNADEGREPRRRRSSDDVKLDGESGKGDRKRDKGQDLSWVAPAAGVAGAAAAVAAIGGKSKKEESREDRRERRRRERQREDEEDAAARSERRRRKDQDRQAERESDRDRIECDEQPYDKRDAKRKQIIEEDASHSKTKSVWQEAASARKLVHEDYQTFFAPPEILNKPTNQAKVSNPDPNADVDFDKDAAVIEIVPKIGIMDPDEPEFSPADKRNPTVDLSELALPWDVPELKLVNPTPPASRTPTPFFEASDVHKDNLEDAAEEPRQPQQIDQYAERSSEEPNTAQDSGPSSKQHHRTGRTHHYSDSESEERAPPVVVAETKPFTESAEAKKSVAATEDDFDFAATLAAGAEDAGFDPSIVINDPGYHRRESPPGTNDNGKFASFDDEVASARRKKDKKKRKKSSKDNSLPTAPEERRRSAIVDDIVSQVQHTPDDKVSPLDDVASAKAVDDYGEGLIGQDPRQEEAPSNGLVFDKESANGQKSDVGSLESAITSTSSGKGSKSKSKKGSLWKRVFDATSGGGQDDSSSAGHGRNPKHDQDISQVRGESIVKTHLKYEPGEKTPELKGSDGKRAVDTGTETQNQQPEYHEAVPRGDVVTPASVLQYLEEERNGDSKAVDERSTLSESFLGMRPDPPPPPDIELAGKYGRSQAQDAMPTTPRAHQRRPSDMNLSESQQSMRGLPSPTAVPVNFRRPRPVSGPPRSASESPLSSMRGTTEIRPKPRPRPKSTEFKTSTAEMRPLWLVERRQPHHNLASSETYPPLPESHSTSAASSVNDPDEMRREYDYRQKVVKSADETADPFISGHETSTDILGSQQPTPTTASFASQSIKLPSPPTQREPSPPQTDTRFHRASSASRVKEISIATTTGAASNAALHKGGIHENATDENIVKSKFGEEPSEFVESQRMQPAENLGFPEEASISAPLPPLVTPTKQPESHADLAPDAFEISSKTIAEARHAELETDKSRKMSMKKSDSDDIIADLPPSAVMQNPPDAIHHEESTLSSTEQTASHNSAEPSVPAMIENESNPLKTEIIGRSVDIQLHPSEMVNEDSQLASESLQTIPFTSAAESSQKTINEPQIKAEHQLEPPPKDSVADTVPSNGKSAFVARTSVDKPASDFKDAEDVNQKERPVESPTKPVEESLVDVPFSATKKRKSKKGREGKTNVQPLESAAPLPGEPLSPPIEKERSKPKDVASMTSDSADSEGRQVGPQNERGTGITEGSGEEPTRAEAGKLRLSDDQAQGSAALKSALQDNLEGFSKAEVDPEQKPSASTVISGTHRPPDVNVSEPRNDPIVPTESLGEALGKSKEGAADGRTTTEDKDVNEDELTFTAPKRKKSKSKKGKKGQPVFDSAEITGGPAASNDPSYNQVAAATEPNVEGDMPLTTEDDGRFSDVGAFASPAAIDEAISKQGSKTVGERSAPITTISAPEADFQDAKDSLDLADSQVHDQGQATPMREVNKQEAEPKHIEANEDFIKTYPSQDFDTTNRSLVGEDVPVLEGSTDLPSKPTVSQPQTFDEADFLKTVGLEKDPSSEIKISPVPSTQPDDAVHSYEPEPFTATPVQGKTIISHEGIRDIQGLETAVSTGVAANSTEIGLSEEPQHTASELLSRGSPALSEGKEESSGFAPFSKQGKQEKKSKTLDFAEIEKAEADSTNPAAVPKQLQAPSESQAPVQSQASRTNEPPPIPEATEQDFGFAVNKKGKKKKKSKTIDYPNFEDRDAGVLKDPATNFTEFQDREESQISEGLDKAFPQQPAGIDETIEENSGFSTSNKSRKKKKPKALELDQDGGESVGILSDGPVEPDNIVESVDDVEDLGSTQPVQPIEPIEPSETVKSIEPVETMKTTEPAGPTEPASPFIDAIADTGPSNVDPVAPSEFVEAERGIPDVDSSFSTSKKDKKNDKRKSRESKTLLFDEELASAANGAPISTDHPTGERASVDNVPSDPIADVSAETAKEVDAIEESGSLSRSKKEKKKAKKSKAVSFEQESPPVDINGQVMKGQLIEGNEALVPDSPSVAQAVDVSEKPAEEVKPFEDFTPGPESKKARKEAKKSKAVFFKGEEALTDSNATIQSDHYIEDRESPAQDVSTKALGLTMSEEPARELEPAQEHFEAPRRKKDKKKAKKSRVISFEEENPDELVTDTVSKQPTGDPGMAADDVLVESRPTVDPESPPAEAEPIGESATLSKSKNDKKAKKVKAIPFEEEGGPVQDDSLGHTPAVEGTAAVDDDMDVQLPTDPAEEAEKTSRAVEEPFPMFKNKKNGKEVKKVQSSLSCEEAVVALESTAIPSEAVVDREIQPGREDVVPKNEYAFLEIRDTSRMKVEAPSETQEPSFQLKEVPIMEPLDVLEGERTILETKDSLVVDDAKGVAAAEIHDEFAKANPVTADFAVPKSKKETKKTKNDRASKSKTEPDAGDMMPDATAEAGHGSQEVHIGDDSVEVQDGVQEVEEGPRSVEHNSAVSMSKKGEKKSKKAQVAKAGEKVDVGNAHDGTTEQAAAGEKNVPIDDGAIGDQDTISDVAIEPKPVVDDFISPKSKKEKKKAKMKSAAATLLEEEATPEVAEDTIADPTPGNEYSFPTIEPIGSSENVAKDVNVGGPPSDEIFTAPKSKKGKKGKKNKPLGTDDQIITPVAALMAEDAEKPYEKPFRTDQDSAQDSQDAHIPAQATEEVSQETKGQRKKKKGKKTRFLSWDDNPVTTEDAETAADTSVEFPEQTVSAEPEELTTAIPGRLSEGYGGDPSEIEHKEASGLLDRPVISEDDHAAAQQDEAELQQDLGLAKQYVEDQQPAMNEDILFTSDVAPDEPQTEKEQERARPGSEKSLPTGSRAAEELQMETKPESFKGIEHISSQPQTAEEIRPTEVEGPQGEILESNPSNVHEGKIDFPEPSNESTPMFSKVRGEDQDSSDRVPRDYVEGRSETLGQACTTTSEMIESTPDKQAYASLRDSSENVEGALQSTDETPAKGGAQSQEDELNDDGVGGFSAFPTKKKKKDKKKAKSVKITSEKPEIIEEPQSKVIEQESTPPTIETPGSVDLLDADEQRQYNEAYARELERQLNSKADDQDHHEQQPTSETAEAEVIDQEVQSGTEQPDTPAEYAAGETSIGERFRPAAAPALDQAGIEQDDFAQAEAIQQMKKGKKDKKKKKAREREQEQLGEWEGTPVTDTASQEADEAALWLDSQRDPLELEEHIEAPAESAAASYGNSFQAEQPTGPGEEIQGTDYFGIKPSQRAEEDVGTDGNEDRRAYLGRQDHQNENDLQAPAAADQQIADIGGEEILADEWNEFPTKKGKKGKKLKRKPPPQEIVEAAVKMPELEIAEADKPEERLSDDLTLAADERFPHAERPDAGDALGAAASISAATVVAEGLTPKHSKKDKKKDKKRKKAAPATEDELPILERDNELTVNSQEDTSETVDISTLSSPDEKARAIEEFHAAQETHSYSQAGEAIDDQSNVHKDPSLLPVVEAGSMAGDHESLQDIDDDLTDSQAFGERDIIDDYALDPSEPGTPLRSESVDTPVVEQVSGRRTNSGQGRRGSEAEQDIIASYEADAEEPSVSPIRETDGLDQSITSPQESLGTETKPRQDVERSMTPETRSRHRKSRQDSKIYDSDDSADSGFDVQKRRRRESLQAEDYRQPSPVDSTTKDRSSALFDSSPSGRDAVLAELRDKDETSRAADSLDDNSRGQAEYDYISPDVSSQPMTDEVDRPSLFGGPLRQDDAAPSTRSRAPSEMRGRRLPSTISERSSEGSPRSLLQRKDKRDISDLGSPTQGPKARKTSENRSEQDRVSEQKAGPPTPLSLQTSQDKNRSLRRSFSPLSADVDRAPSRQSNASTAPSLVAHRGVRSPGIGSPDSIHAIIRTPEHVRSASGSSFRSTGTPPLRRVDHSASGDLRAASRRSERGAKIDANRKITEEAEPAAESEAGHEHDIPYAASSTYDPLKDKGKNRVDPDEDMADYEGWGDVRGQSPMSPTRPPSMRKRQSMQFAEMEQRIAMLASENGLLQTAKTKAEKRLEEQASDHSQQRENYEVALREHKTYVVQRDNTLKELNHILEGLRQQVADLTEANNELAQSREVEQGPSREDWEQTSRELDSLKVQHTLLISDHEDALSKEMEAVRQRDVELIRLRQELEGAKEQIRKLQQQILASRSTDDIVERDEDYFEAKCQELCKHLTNWVTRFSKLSDKHRCFMAAAMRDESHRDLFEDSILDGSEVDAYLQDRHKRRDVFMSVSMTLIFKHIFARYLFGMDQEHRQKLKALDKTLVEVGPLSAVHKWRATTLTLLSKRPAFKSQREAESEGVVQDIWATLSTALPPPSTPQAEQCKESLRRVVHLAIDLHVEMRLQRAEYSMLPPPEPDFDPDTGDVRNRLDFVADSMNERSAVGAASEDLEGQGAWLRIVLFPLVTKGTEEDEVIIVYPAQVHVAPLKKGKTVRVVSAQGGRSEASYADGEDDTPMEGGFF